MTFDLRVLATFSTTTLLADSSRVRVTIVTLFGEFCQEDALSPRPNCRRRSPAPAGRGRTAPSQVAQKWTPAPMKSSSPGTRAAGTSSRAPPARRAPGPRCRRRSGRRDTGRRSRRPHLRGRQHLDAEAPALGGQPVGELGAADALREAGEVVEPLGDARPARPGRSARRPASRCLRAPRRAPPSARPARRRRSSGRRTVLFGRVWRPSFSASSALDGSTRIEPSGKKIVGMIRFPLFVSSTIRSPSASASTSMKS